jgi:hypothetical protein
MLGFVGIARGVREDKMSDALLEELQESMGKTGPITTLEHRLMLRAISQNVKNTNEIKTILEELTKEMRSNPVVVYGRWLYTKPAIAISITLAIMSVFIIIVSQAETQEAWGWVSFLAARIK